MHEMCLKRRFSHLDFNRSHKMMPEATFILQKILIFSVFWKVHKLLPEAEIILENDTQLIHHLKKIILKIRIGPRTLDCLLFLLHTQNPLCKKIYTYGFIKFCEQCSMLID